MTRDYQVISPIKMGKEMREEDRPAALPGQGKPTHTGELVTTGTVNLTDEEAAPLLEAGAIQLTSIDPASAHDPEVVGYAGSERRNAALAGEDPNSPDTETKEKAKSTRRQSSTGGK
jgi:hypothetical protein